MLRCLILSCVGLVLGTGAWAQTPGPEPGSGVVKPADFQAASQPVGGLMARTMRERREEPKAAPGDRINFYLAKPDGDGPFPAVVILPACIGVTPFVRDTLTSRLPSWSYVGLVVDSWRSRNKNGEYQRCLNSTPIASGAQLRPT